MSFREKKDNDHTEVLDHSSDYEEDGFEGVSWRLGDELKVW